MRSRSLPAQCCLGLGRIKLQRNKRQLQLRQTRKEVADLLRTGKQVRGVCRSACPCKVRHVDSTQV